MTEKRTSQVILEVAETPSTNERRVSQAILEVAETPSTNQRNVSQIILEVSYTPLSAVSQSVDSLIYIKGTKTQSIDSLISKTITTTQSVDALLKILKSYSLDVLIKKTQTKTQSADALLLLGIKTHSIDILIKIQQTKTYSVDTVLSKAGIKKTVVVDAYLLPTDFLQTALDISIAGPLGKNHLVDALRKKTISVGYSIDTFLFLSRNIKAYNLDALLLDTTDPVISGDLDTALSQPTIRPTIRASRIISRNSTIANIPTITISDAGELKSNLANSMIDGYERSSMKFIFLDGDATTNDDYRIFPDNNKWESDNDIEDQKIPWISEQLCSDNGTLTPIVFKVSYASDQYDNEFNMVEFVTDKWGKGQAGIITDMDIEVSDDNVTWSSIASGVSAFSCPDPHRFQMFYYFDQDLVDYIWSTDKEAFLNDANGATLAKVVYPYVRFTINSISVDGASSTKPRHFLAYECGAFLWEIGEAVSVSVQEDRDLSSQTLSPAGASVSNSFGLTLTAAGRNFPYYKYLADPLGPDNDQFQNAQYEIEVGVKLADDSYVYLPYGKYLADSMNLSAPDGVVQISGRDYSKILQETKMPSMFYREMYLHEVIRDIIERAGIEDFEVDTTEYKISDMAPAEVLKWMSDDDLFKVKEPNLLWTNDQTCWEFLQTIAYADLGVFYFDRNGTFIYHSKEDLRRDNDTFDFSLTEEGHILSFSSSSEMMKNAFKISYKSPRITPNPVGLWSATDEEILDATALTEDVDSVTKRIPVGDITDWAYEGFVQIENEIIKYKDRDEASLLDCERGWLGTKATEHLMNNSNGAWTFVDGNWSTGGGVLSASTNGDWGTALIDVNASKYNLHAVVTINEEPYRAGIVVRALNGTKHFRFVMTTSSVIGTPGGDGNTYEHMYVLQEISNSGTTTLKGVDWNRARASFLTGEPVRVRAQVDGRHLSFFVKGSRVLTYDITDDDIQVDLPAKAGFAAKGTGPTTFESVYIATLSEDRRGETIIFRANFGLPVYEIRRYEVEYSPERWTPPNGVHAQESETTPPAAGVQYIITNSDAFTVPYWYAGPFKAVIYVKNETSSLAILNGTGGADDVIAESFYMTGYAVYKQDEKMVESENDAQIQRYGRQEFVAQLPWVQSPRHARLLLNYIKGVFGAPVLFLNVEIHPRIDIEIGDIVEIGSVDQEFWFSRIGHRFYVVGCSVSIDANGLKQTLNLRSISGLSI